MRHSLFSKFDQAQVDAAGLYTMIPEIYALELAKKVGGPRVLDVCSGIGSMSIAMARMGRQVTAVEIDEKRVAMAQHNAELYQVGDRIDFRLADVTNENALRSLPADIQTAFLDPPWGKGPGDYQRRHVTYLEHLCLANMDLRELVSKLPCREVVMRLPPNFDLGIFRNVTGDKAGFSSGSGRVHWYFIRTTKQQFIDIPDRTGQPGGPGKI